jgi:hypothetical protein
MGWFDDDERQAQLVKRDLRLMAQRPRRDGLRAADTVVVNCRLPRDLHAELTLLALNPRTGRIPYGGWSRLIEDMARTWLESKKVSAQGV